MYTFVWLGPQCLNLTISLGRKAISKECETFKVLLVPWAIMGQTSRIPTTDSRSLL